MKAFLTHSLTQNKIVDKIYKHEFVNGEIRKKDIRKIVRIMMKIIANGLTPEELDFMLNWYRESNPFY